MKNKYKKIFPVLCFFWLTLSFSPASLAMHQVKRASSERSLVFLDEWQEKDLINFLYEKYKNNPSIMKKSQMLLETEKSALNLLKQNVPSRFNTNDDFFEASLGQYLLSVYQNELLELGPNQIAQLKFLDVKNKEQFISTSAIESLIYQLKYARELIKPGLVAPELTCLEDILIGAHQIDHLEITDGIHPILFLGRTPSFVKIAYEELLERYHPERLQQYHILSLSYSKTPDMENIRDIGNLGYQDIIALNLVTNEKLQFFCEYMDRQHINTVQEKLYLVDIVGKGAALNSFLRILRYYFTVYLGRKMMPDVVFIGLNLDYNNGIKQDVYTYNAYDREIVFRSRPELGIRALRIKAIPLALRCGTTKLLDEPFIQELVSKEISFPAQRWRNHYNDKLSSGGLGSNFSMALLRIYIRTIIKKHHDVYQDIVSKIID